jgi:hypothetical protein
MSGAAKIAAQPHRLQLLPQSPPAFAGAGYCPKCQGAAAKDWLAAREADLLPVDYFHLVFTLPAEIAPIAYQNKSVVYDLLFRTASETVLTIAADPKHLGARIGITAVLHTWGSAMTHHPHVHMIVPGGGLTLDNARWVASRSNFLVHVNVLARLFRGKMLAMLVDAHDSGQLTFFNTHAGLAEKRTFKRFIAALRRIHWVAHCKAPFAGPEQVLRYLSRYTHRVAHLEPPPHCSRQHQHRVPLEGLSHQRPGPLEDDAASPARVHQALPDARAAQGLHRIRHYGLFANANRAENIATARALLLHIVPPADPQKQPDITPDALRVLPCPCPRCAARMIVIEVFARGCEPRWRPMPSRVDTS